MAALLADDVATAFGARAGALQRFGLVDVDRLDPELVDVGAVVVLGVGDRGLQDLLDDLGALFRAEREEVERAANRQAANLVGDEPALLGRQANSAQRGIGFHRWLLTSFSAARAQRPSCLTSGP